jgi:hypothetical protein
VSSLHRTRSGGGGGGGGALSASTSSSSLDAYAQGDDGVRNADFEDDDDALCDAFASIDVKKRSKTTPPFEEATTRKPMRLVGLT